LCISDTAITCVTWNQMYIFIVPKVGIRPHLESQVYLLPKYNLRVNKRNPSQMDAFRSKY